jgi:hypothetical protein
MNALWLACWVTDAVLQFVPGLFGQRNNNNLSFDDFAMKYQICNRCSELKRKAKCEANKQKAGVHSKSFEYQVIARTTPQQFEQARVKVRY